MGEGYSFILASVSALSEWRLGLVSLTAIVRALKVGVELLIMNH